MTVSVHKRAAIAIRHVAFEDLGLLGPILQRGGWEMSYRDAPIDDLTDPAIETADLLIVLGGPIGVYETDAYPFLAAEITVLERRLSRGRPTLGICLGAQLMARALGARVFPGPVKEIGWGAVELTEAGAASSLKPLADAAARVLHWHGDTFDLPSEVIRLAGNANYPNQAFAIGEWALALQFHIEADPARLDLWLVGHAAELAAAKISVPDLRAATHDIAAQAETQARQIFEDWLHRVAGQAERQINARTSENFTRSPDD
jgi:GMP synthase (glutamine-hydrolysing)